MTIRVLVVDDQSMVRAGFRLLLSGEEDIEVVAEAKDGFEAVDRATRVRPTVVLMDIRMPGLDGLEATRRILAADDRARILILTTFDLDEYVYEALRAGASGFVLKDDPPNSFLPPSVPSPLETPSYHRPSPNVSSSSSLASPGGHRPKSSMSSPAASKRSCG